LLGAGRVPLCRSVTKKGNSAGGGAIDSDGIATMTYDAATNRITASANFIYDEAGNQTQSDENGFIRNYRYDAAGWLYDRSTTTKLDYAVNRSYNAGLGRFTQVNPIGDPQSQATLRKKTNSARIKSRGAQ
jgi:hypothetical protein